jgi:hypothetical protein
VGEADFRPELAKSTLRWNSPFSWCYASYVPLLIPVILFIISLSVRPTIYTDSGWGFFALRSMQEGGPFHAITSPDPDNIAGDVATFQGWWSPGQYMVPGFFVWLGADYGVAMSLTTLIATLIGLIGWLHVARSFALSPFTALLFVSGLATFRYATLAFRIYHGGEVLQFAVAPWSLYALRQALNKPPAACLVISLLTAGVLFFAKLSGLIVFAANVLAITLLDVMRERRVRSSTVAMWVASAMGSLLFHELWVARGEVVTSGSYTVSWDAIWLPITGAVLTGFSGFDLWNWLFQHSSASILSQLLSTYLLVPLCLLLILWVWARLRETCYRPMAICLLVIIGLYTATIAVFFIRQGSISFQDRYLRYAGILLLLLLLVAIDQLRSPLAKVFATLFIAAFSAYGLLSYTTKAWELTEGRYYDSLTGTSQQVVSPKVLEYLRSESVTHNWYRPIAVLPALDAVIGLPRFRIVYIRLDVVSRDAIASQTWAGRVDKIFVIVQEKMLRNSKVEALLQSFVDYEFARWEQTQLDGMVVYSQ